MAVAAPGNVIAAPGWSCSLSVSRGFYFLSPQATWLTITVSQQHPLLTYGLDEGGAGGLDHHVRVQEDSLQQGLGEGGQLGDQRRQSKVDPQSVVRELTDPELSCECWREGLY